MTDVLVFLGVAYATCWLWVNHFKEKQNRKFDEAWTRYAREDYCPRCFRPDVVVVRADTTGALYGACGACDQEVLL